MAIPWCHHGNQADIYILEGQLNNNTAQTGRPQSKCFNCTYKFAKFIQYYILDPGKVHQLKN